MTVYFDVDERAFMALFACEFCARNEGSLCEVEPLLRGVCPECKRWLDFAPGTGANPKDPS